MLDELSWLASEDPAELLAYLGVHRDSSIRHVAATDEKLVNWIEACRLMSDESCVVQTMWNDLSEKRYRANLMNYIRTWGDALEAMSVPSNKIAAALRDAIGNPWNLATREHLARCLSCGGDGYFKGASLGDEMCSACSGLDVPPQIASIAQEIYNTSNFESMSILADALEDNGCPPEVPCQACKGVGFEKDDAVDMLGLGLGSGIDALTSILGVLTDAKKMKEYVSREAWRVACDNCNGTGKRQNPVLEHLRSSGRHFKGCHVLALVLGKKG